jgi:NADH-quinone oxidoreductase subunit H
MKMGFYLFADMQICLFPLILAILFFGGYNYPGMSWVVESGELILVTFFRIWCFIYSGFIFFFYMWVRWTIPRFRYDQLMHLGWRILIPLSIINIIITGIVILRAEIATYLGF